MRIKINDNLRAIYTYINSYEYKIILNDFIQWCFDYGYYKEFFLNFHVIKECIAEHNLTHTILEPVRVND